MNKNGKTCSTTTFCYHFFEGVPSSTLLQVGRDRQIVPLGHCMHKGTKYLCNHLYIYESHCKFPINVFCEGVYYLASAPTMTSVSLAIPSGSG